MMGAHRRMLSVGAAVAMAGLGGLVAASGCTTSSRKQTATPVATSTATVIPSTTRTASSTATRTGTATMTRTTTLTATITPPVPTPWSTPASGYAVVFGGSTAGSASFMDVFVSTIQSNGSLGSWTTGPNPMPSPVPTTLAATTAMWAVKWAQPTPYVIYGHPAEPMGSQYLYLSFLASAPAGGPSSGTGPWAVGSPIADAQGTPYSTVWGSATTDGSYVYTVESGSGNGCALIGAVAGGTVTGWNVSGSCLGVDLDNFPMIEEGGFLFTLGGRSGGTAIIGDIYRTQVTGSGIVGSWSSIGQIPFPIRRAPHQAAVVTIGGQSRVYLVGGYDNSATLTTVFQATIGFGAIGAWSAGTALPAPREYGTLLSYQASGNYYLALVGGRDGTTEVSSAYYTQINASTGALGSWTTTSPLPAPRHMHAAVVF